MSHQHHANHRSARRAVRLFTALFILSIWGGFVLWLVHEQTTMRAVAGVALERERVTAETQISGVLRQAELFLVAADRFVTDHPGSDPRSDPQFAELVRAFQRVTDGGMLVRLIDESGALSLVPAEGGTKVANVSDRDYFNDAMAAPAGQLSIGVPFQGRVTGRWAVPLATRLSHPVKNVSVLLVAIETSLFNRLFESVRINADSVVSVIRRDGILLARSSARPVDLGISYATFPVFTEGLARAPRGVMLAPSTRTDGVPRMVAYGEMERYPLVTLVGESVQSINAPLWHMFWIMVSLLLPLTLGVLFLAWRSTRLLSTLLRRDEALSQLATTDSLTGLSNRRYFLESCAEEMLRARRYRQPLAFFELDLDFFKRINDAYGHAAGDAVLKALARVGQACLRDVDHFGRLGGEEFGMLLPNTDAVGALHLAERIVAAVAACEVPVGGLILRFTTSIGVTALGADDLGFEEVYARADKALYEAKAAGRNCARIVAPPPLAEIPDESTKDQPREKNNEPLQ